MTSLARKLKTAYEKLGDPDLADMEEAHHCGLFVAVFFCLDVSFLFNTQFLV